MRNAEELRRMYNERFSGPSGHWTSEDIVKCRKMLRRVIRWSCMSNKKGLSALDVGCALGYYTKAFYLEGFEAYGLDYSEVAIEKAKVLHPECHFIHGDGFNPQPGRSFDLIFCRGFSGSNTHDLGFVATWTNKYIGLLKTGGRFVFSFSTDYSGKEAENETVNWSVKEMLDYAGKVGAEFCGIRYYYRLGPISWLVTKVMGFIKRRKAKRYFYLIFRKNK